MAGWNADFAGHWESNAGHENGNIAVGNENWVYTDAPATETYDDPTWTSSFIDGMDILLERVDDMLNNGFLNVSADVVLEDPSQYQIVNFWSEEIYLSAGHFDGAYRIKPISIADNIVKQIDLSKTTLVYCYTGQTSSMIVAWLNVLGYDAKSILFGVNHLNYDGLEEYAEASVLWHGSYEYDYIVE